MSPAKRDSRPSRLVNLVQKSPTDWVMCDICRPNSRPYFPGSMKAAVPVAGKSVRRRPHAAPGAPPIPLAGKMLQKRWWLLLVAAFMLWPGPWGHKLGDRAGNDQPAPALFHDLVHHGHIVEAPL